ncbi:hypothetical protein G8770_18715 [Aestuariicella hydrocarbonica]|uniref:Membrane protein YjdF n=1 Tax=Pseudomaricurvus hydrocarbonicus TaxID=1470433 RepID=A0A9E5MNS1_9GAMM|nr:hypothetical protein [Aestuariicella hydrocarbonica]NHO67583.1 hypothetical protein [Aestuariicella hydrocarbonica]
MQIHLPSIHKNLSLIIQAILCIGLVTMLWKQEWAIAAFTSMIILLTFVPLIVHKRFHVYIPPEFELLATAFLFSSLFLGEVGGYYTRFWWWDIALHASSGFLLGIVGFLLAHILNETERIDIDMHPGFIALFSFFFAVGVGAIWEIVEFTIDSFTGTSMQKPMLKDPSGLTDTMWDLIVDTVGALVISILGYGYLKAAGNNSFLERWIHHFVKRNPQFFKHLE